MIIRRGKAIDSARLKRDLDKSQSIRSASAFSRGIPKGEELGACLLCGSQDYDNLVEIYGFRYRECTGCGVVYVGNPPSEEDLAAAYQSDYYTEANRILLANDNVIDYRVSQIAEPKVDFVLQHITGRKRAWLDVGCGVGEILGVAKARGFVCRGIEVNRLEADYARNRFGIEVVEEYVTDDKLAAFRGAYGVISLFSVLEHVTSPRTLLARMASIQDLGDNLVIEVPAYPSISAFSQITFPEHVNRMMHPPLHLFLFPFRALERLLDAHGYQVRAAWYFGQDFYELFSTLGLFVPSLNGSPLHERLAPMLNDFQRVIDEHGMSDEMLVVAERTG